MVVEATWLLRVLPDGLAHGQNGMLCGAVDAAVGKDHPRRHRSDLNDEPAAFNQVGKADVQGGQHAFDVDIDHGVPIGEVRLVHGGEDTQPGIGNGHVEPPKCCDTARHGFLLGCRVQDIQSVRHHAAFTLGACPRPLPPRPPAYPSCGPWPTRGDRGRPASAQWPHRYHCWRPVRKTDLDGRGDSMEAKIPVHPRSSTGDQENEACMGPFHRIQRYQSAPPRPSGGTLIVDRWCGADGLGLFAPRATVGFHVAIKNQAPIRCVQLARQGAAHRLTGLYPHQGCRPRVSPPQRTTASLARRAPVGPDTAGHHP